MIQSLRAISCPGLHGKGSVGVRTPASKAMPIDIAFDDWLRQNLGIGTSTSGHPDGLEQGIGDCLRYF
jgi:hypothetical protein